MRRHPLYVAYHDFDNFDVEKVARYDAEKLDSLMQNPGIIRSRLKTNAAVRNAHAFMRVQAEFGSFYPTYFGQWVYFTLALDLRRIRSISLLIEKKLAGPFALELARIGLYTQSEVI